MNASAAEYLLLRRQVLRSLLMSQPPTRVRLRVSIYEGPKVQAIRQTSSFAKDMGVIATRAANEDHSATTQLVCKDKAADMKFATQTCPTYQSTSPLNRNIKTTRATAEMLPKHSLVVSSCSSPTAAETKGGNLDIKVYNRELQRILNYSWIGFFPPCCIC